MFRRFAPAEFTAFHVLSWLRQFKAAMRIRDISPRDALRALLDTDLKRWKSICENISDITLVENAIEFLGEQSDATKTCCGDLHADIEKTIPVIKKAAYPRRSSETQKRLERARNAKRELMLDRSRAKDIIYGYKQEYDDTTDLARKAELQSIMIAEGRVEMSLSKRIRRKESEIEVLERYLNTLQ